MPAPGVASAATRAVLCAAPRLSICTANNEASAHSGLDALCAPHILYPAHLAEAPTRPLGLLTAFAVALGLPCWSFVCGRDCIRGSSALACEPIAGSTMKRTSAPLLLADISAEEFFRSFWRRRPRLCRGGGDRILGFRLTAPQVLEIAEQLQAHQPQFVGRDRKVMFAQHLDLANSALLAVVRRYRTVATFPHIWFDGSWTRDGAGLGSHFDIADSFILQQSGRKLWRLHPPGCIGIAERRRRLLKESPLDLTDMPDTPQVREFVLEPGDLLYVPCMWVHWGISLGEAASLSLGFTADTAMDWVSTLTVKALAGHALSSPDASALPVAGAAAYLANALSSVRARRQLAGAVASIVARDDLVPPALDRRALLHDLMPMLRRVLELEKAWWQPLPVVPCEAVGTPAFAKIARDLAGRLSACFIQHSWRRKLEKAMQGQPVLAARGRGLAAALRRFAFRDEP